MHTIFSVTIPYDGNGCAIQLLQGSSAGTIFVFPNLSRCRENADGVVSNDDAVMYAHISVPFVCVHDEGAMKIILKSVEKKGG